MGRDCGRFCETGAKSPERSCTPCLDGVNGRSKQQQHWPVVGGYLKQISFTDLSLSTGLKVKISDSVDGNKEQLCIRTKHKVVSLSLVRPSSSGLVF
jgi:hypothetical protein